MASRRRSLFTVLLLAAGLLAGGALPAQAAPPSATCPGGAKITVDSFSSNDPGTRVTATFRVPAECGSVRLTLATYAVSPDGKRTRLEASTSATITGGAGTHDLSVAGPGCDQDVFLVVGDVKDDPNAYTDAQIVDVGSDTTFADCTGFEDTTTTTSSTTTTTTTAPPGTTTTTSTTAPPTPTTDPECTGVLQPSDRLEPGASRVDLTATRATATFTVRPGCGNVELSLASYTISLAGRSGIVDSAIGTFGPGTHTAVLGINLRVGCLDQAVLAVGQPDRDVFELIHDGRYVTAGESGVTGQACGPGDHGTPRPGVGALPFTGAGLTMPLLAAGLTLLVVGTITLAGTRRRRMSRART